jgi:hypothetical protein
MPFAVTYKGTAHKIKASAFAKLAAENVLLHGENVQLYGTYGTGKSTMMEMIQYYVSSLANTMVVVLSPTDLSIIQKNSAKFLHMLSPDPTDENPTKVVFFIDDAEKALLDQGGVHTEDNTIILALMDGDWKQQLNCSTIMSFNAPKEKLNQGIFRSGRSGLSAEIGPLNTEYAHKAVKALRRELTSKTFDDALFNELLRTDNRLPNGVVYSPSGTITIADLSKACFKNREYTAAVIAAIKASAEPDIEEAPAPSEVRPKVVQHQKERKLAPPPVVRR